MAVWHKFWQDRVGRERRDRISRWERYLGERGIDVKQHPMCTKTSIVRDAPLVPKDAVPKPTKKPVPVFVSAAAALGAEEEPERKPTPKLRTFMLLPRGVGEEPATPPQAHRPVWPKHDPALYSAERLVLPRGPKSRSSASTVVSIRSAPDLRAEKKGGSVAGSATLSRLSHSVEPESLISQSVRSSRIDALLPKVPDMVAAQLRAALDPIHAEIEEEQARRRKAEQALAALRK